MHYQPTRRVAIIGGLRIPFCRAHTNYAEASNQDMMTAVLKGLVGRYRLEGQRLGDVSLGAVMKHSRDWNLARESVLGSGLAAETPAFDIQRACGTSLEAAILIGNKIALGQIDSGIAAGTDSISDAPVVYPDEYRKILLRSYRGKTFGQRISPWLGLRPRHFKPALPGVTEPRTGLSMGQSTEMTAKAMGHHAPGAGRAGAGEPPERGPRLGRGLLRRPRDAVAGREGGQQHPPRYDARAARQAQARLRPRPAGHDDRGQQHAAHRRRGRRAARLRGLGGDSTACRCRPTCATARSRRWTSSRPRAC